MTFKLLDVVETTVSIPASGILSGALAVEFTNDNGETVALVPPDADQI